MLPSSIQHLRNRTGTRAPRQPPSPPTAAWTSNGDADANSDTDMDSLSTTSVDPPAKSLVKFSTSPIPDTSAGYLVDGGASSTVFSVLPTPIVEIDPTHCKPQRSQRRPETTFCLPSPLTSILGPQRTLHMLNESILPHPQRPVRSVREHLNYLPVRHIYVLSLHA